MKHGLQFLSCILRISKKKEKKVFSSEVQRLCQGTSFDD